ncbi:hypothetical protein B0I35DRAFT_472684 [Stachybotrys elegans]|uniref:Acid phosphatase-like protein n=1 Tax=Stachybotrys elegans TaxID=80388 RepID=A0A8K0T4K0_9HYPO|nr:hypothetical protein B0I35DRAFT_472684 [Stachybotrys elegans]
MVSTAGGIAIAVVVLLLAAAIGWVVYTQMRARRLGLPAPSLSSYLPWSKSDQSYGPPRPAPGGIVGWFNDKIRKMRNPNARSAAGSYEQPFQGSRRGFGPLDPDEAWDTRVDHEAGSYGYYGEQELDTRTNTGGQYGMNVPSAMDDDHEQRGRKPSRDVGPPPGARNPFDDDGEASLRGVSPRPMEHGRQAPDQMSLDHDRSERRSVFREDV